MAAAFPGWEPAPGNPETFLLRAIVYRLVVPLAQLAADAGEEIFAAYGEQVVGLAPIPAAPATVTSTWTMIDDAGYTIDEDTLVSVATAGDERVGFRVVETVAVPPGSTATAAGGVLL